MAPKIIELEKYIAEYEPDPEEQKGEVVVFSRRSPKQSILPKTATVDGLYNYIRMLDAETYPKAYIDYGGYKLEFEKTHKDVQGRVVAQVVFTKNN